MSVNRIANVPLPIQPEEPLMSVFISAREEQTNQLQEQEGSRRRFLKFAEWIFRPAKPEVTMSDADVRRWCEGGGELPAPGPVLDYNAGLIRNFPLSVTVTRQDMAALSLDAILNRGEELLARVDGLSRGAADKIKQVLESQVLHNIPRVLAAKIAITLAEVVDEQYRKKQEALRRPAGYRAPALPYDDGYGKDE